LLLAINKEFGEENDNLRRELPKRQKITKEIEKNRKEMYDESADELSVEPKEKEARVCKL
jgi:flagellar motility protein MotE (MotC chaperone)